MIRKKLLAAMLLPFLLTHISCSDDVIGDTSQSLRLPLKLSGQIQQENVTRANDYGFVTGDRMGIYVVDRVNGEAGQLGASGNRAQNVHYTFDGDSYQWTSPVAIYWRDRETPVDIYGYYPGVNYIEKPVAYQFAVQADQSAEAQNGDLSGYERSDLLWGKAANVAYTQEQIVIKYHHILAGVRVSLQRGTGMTDAEWQKLEKTVYVYNTVPSATVDLSTGAVAVAASEGVQPILMASQTGDQYRAIVIPQTVAADKRLIGITLDGQNYSHTLTSAMSYQAGKLHNFTLTINKSEATGDYELALAYDGITPWTNDESSHQFSATAYVTVDCPEGGKLKEAITSAGYDYTAIQNLKVTGTLNDEDFALLRGEMPELKHLNLKEADIKHVYHSYWTSNSNGSLVEYYVDDELPPNAFASNENIRSVVLPKSLKRIGEGAFRGIRLMYSTLEVPEGVTTIDIGAFAFNEYNGVELILPSTLDSICSTAFVNCGYKCELKLSNNISYIGEAAFGVNGGQGEGCANFYGTFSLPSNLKTLEPAMFAGLGRTGKITGTIEIPQGITEIPDYSYWGGVFPSLANRRDLILPAGLKRIGRGSLGGSLNSLHLNDDLEEIMDGNFSYGSMPFQLTLPSSLRRIEENCFSTSQLEGTLVIPEKCLYIGAGCFSNNYFTSIQLPSRLEYINDDCFRSNSQLTTVTIPQYVSYIGKGAFDDCWGLQTVVCLAPEPPELGGDIFQGTDFDKCILQVPEAAVETYRHTDGWKQFKNITPYHELAFNVPEILSLDKGQTVEGVVRAEGAWTVSECPSWVTVSPSSGDGKEEVTVTVKPFDGTGERSGRIVFKLQDKDYTTYTDVRQVAVDGLKEDQQTVLQTASAGATREIPIFIVGEGYSADDIASGMYMEDMKQQMEHLFSCEPYKTYRNYFTVSTAIAVSPESGINGRMRFEPKDWTETRDDLVWQYAKQHGQGISDANEGQTTIIVLMNTNYLGGNTTSLDDGGRTISYLGKSTDTYPYEQREYVLREVGGVAFGHLGVESVNHFTFLKACSCPSCNAMAKYNDAKRLGWYDNISISGKMNDVPWSHLIFHDSYAQYVDMYEGGYNHARGVYRSENMSIMGDAFIPYFNTISRQSIVKRILEYSGEGYTFEKFVAKDKREYPEE